MKKRENETITQGLGIEDSWFENKVEDITRIWKKNEKISEALEEMAQIIKDEEFETVIPVSEYEKKLILAGYVCGQAAGQADQEMTKKMEMLAMMAKLLGNSPNFEDEDEDED
jgi:S-adenosylmethionine synthetase